MPSRPSSQGKAKPPPPTDTLPPAAADPEEATRPRRWFHISDSSVSECSEEKVLKAQAYILFYERIL